MSQSTTLQPFLDRLTSRSALSPVERQAILDLPHRQIRLVAKNDFVRLCDTVVDTSIVVEGVVASFHQTRAGMRQTTALHIRGDAPSLGSALLSKREYGLEALTASAVAMVPHKAIRAVAGQHAGIATAFWRDGAVDASVLSKWVLNVGRQSAHARIAHLLCEMATRYRVTTTGGKASFALPLTQSQFGDATGMTAVHVNRTLKALVRDKVVLVERGVVRILDWPALVRTGEFNPDYLQIVAAAG